MWKIATYACFAVLLRFTLSFVNKVYIGFLSHMRDWTVAAAQYSKFAYINPLSGNVARDVPYFIILLCLTPGDFTRQGESAAT